jgi:phage terminase Nu1 subunit (DNA packaging protein)
MQKTKPAHVGNVPATEAAAKDTGLVTKRTVAKAAAVSTRTIENWTRQKMIPVVRLGKRCVRFHLASVITALRRMEIQEVR